MGSIPIARSTFELLNSLTVSNLAIVEKVQADFVPGLNVITGETGAGKSVLMGALELVLGGRADASIVRDGAKEAEVEAIFGDTTIRRTVTDQGRSRAWVNDESVSIAELKEIGAKLVDVHGPRANQRLMEEDFQRETLDAFGGISLAEGADGGYRRLWAEYRKLKSALVELSVGASEDELELLRYQVNEIESAALCEDDETIAERHAEAAHMREVMESASEITDALGGDQSVESILLALQPKFHSAARHFPEAEEWSKAADELTIKVQQLSRTIADAMSRFDGGAENLEELDMRMTTVNRLKRKYGSSVGEILAKCEEKKARLEALENREARLTEITAQLNDVEGKLRAKAKEITAARKITAEKISKAVTRELRNLGFLQAKFFIEIESVELAEHGGDKVVYMFEPNPGESARALSVIASSGEIARVMLALKSVLAAHDSTDTLVFDEIDANIGGEVGKAVGERLKAVARHRQVIAITHLPQSAVYGERHFVVSKSVRGGRTRTEISTVEGEDRVSEVARMLGGEKLTTVVRKHAKELLQLSS